MKIAILDDYQRIARKIVDWSVLPEGTEIEAVDEHIADLSRLQERLAGSEVIVAMRERTAFGPALLERLPDLRLLVTTGMRNAAIDIEAATAAGVLVCGTGGGGPATAELAWGLILSLLRHIPAEDERMRHGGWQNTVGNELQGKVLGLLGLGRLGSRMTVIGKAFGMALIAWSQNLTAERAAEFECELVAKENLFARSDVLSIHLVLSPRTRGLVGDHELGLMKPSAVLVNTSRGPIVDSTALLRALQDRRIAGAGIDVYDEEPLPAESPFRSLENVVLTPHLGYVTEETYRVFYRDAIEDILAYQKGRPVRVINNR